jgi:DNA-binding CsgD family transcriptional regulator
MQLTALINRGDLDAALQFARAARTSSAALPSYQSRAWASMLLARACAFAGLPSEGARSAAEAERLFATSGIDGIASWCAAGLAKAQLELGAADEAAETLDRLDRYDRSGFGLYEPQVLSARAWAAVARRDRRAAAAILDEAVDTARRRAQPSFEAWAWHDAVRLGVLDLVRSDATQWARPSVAPSLARWEMTQAALGGDVELACRAADRFETMGAPLHAAEACALAAALARRAGSRRAAAQLDARSAALLGTSRPATPLLAARAGTGPLSAREHEIASMAAAGLTNRQIAQQLVVSERTVENHLYRVFAKLGIDARDQLAPLLS